MEFLAISLNKEDHLTIENVESLFTSIVPGGQKAASKNTDEYRINA